MFVLFEKLSVKVASLAWQVRSHSATPQVRDRKTSFRRNIALQTSAGSFHSNN
jgi:hypothetical protein